MQKESAGNLSPNERWSVPDVNGDGMPDDFLDAEGNEVDGGNGVPDIVDTGWLLPYGGDAWSNDEWYPAPKMDYRYQLHSLQVDWDMGFSRLTFIPTMNKNSRGTINDFMMGIAAGIGRFAPGTSGDAFRETQYTAEL